MSPVAPRRRRRSTLEARLAAGIALWWLGAVLALAAAGGIGYLSVGAYLHLARVVTPAQAALTTGAGLLVVVLGAVVGLRLKFGQPRAARVPEHADLAAAEALVRSALGGGGGDWVARHPGMATVLALATGVSAGANPTLAALLEALARGAVREDGPPGGQ